ncbi:general secretion pathway protein E [Listeria floridensis FSL S10-1187]|uniref:General secretion pathway protein E n=1 Tax=Listeria floridensis FSL S10-1187 TaxID=1265817 RepID=A0ABP3AYS0_9LIST|nr:competence type IV pilus ATPase ComGA [Listeria floridensis]EUJ31772.1 general secretion pathway protein E [Listeria floridensis FSL S10-1187]
MPKTILENLLHYALSLNASDIHLHPCPNGASLRIRVAGRLYPFKLLDQDAAEKLTLYLKFQSGLDIGEKRLPQSGTLDYDFRSEKIALRISTLPHSSGAESIVLRLFRYNRALPFLESTLFSNESQAILSCCTNQTGLFLFSGSTGSGKSSSMYALAEIFSSRELLSVITIEDPVEHGNNEFLQVEINEKAGLGYSSVIRSVLRHDPDLLIIGEIRDSKTAKMVVRAALTGHLVLSTVHADSLSGIIARMLEFEIPEAHLKQALLGVSHQSLHNVYCPLCLGNCELYCTHLTEKQTVLYEQATKSATLSLLFSGEEKADGLSIAQQIEKGVNYGFF